MSVDLGAVDEEHGCNPTAALVPLLPVSEQMFATFGQLSTPNSLDVERSRRWYWLPGGAPGHLEAILDPTAASAFSTWERASRVSRSAGSTARNPIRQAAWGGAGSVDGYGAEACIGASKFLSTPTPYLG